VKTQPSQEGGRASDQSWASVLPSLGQYHRPLFQLSNHFDQKDCEKPNVDGTNNGDIQSIKDSEEQRSKLLRRPIMLVG